MTKCPICQHQYDMDSSPKICPECGSPSSLFPEDSAKEPAAVHKTPDEATPSKSTSAIKIHFPDETAAKKVVPIPRATDEAEAPPAPPIPNRPVARAQGRDPRPWLRVVSLVTAGVALHVALTAVIVVLLRPNTPAPERPPQAQARTPVGGGATQTVNAPDTTEEKQTREPSEEVAPPRESSGEELDKAIADKELKAKELDAVIAAKERKVRELKNKIVLEDHRLKERKGELTSANRELRRLQTEIAQGGGRAKKLKAEVAAKERRLKDLRAEIAQGERQIKDLKRELAGSRNAGYGRRNGQTIRRGPKANPPKVRSRGSRRATTV